MCFDGKKQPFEKKNTIESTTTVITKKCSKNQKLNSFQQMMKCSNVVSSLIRSLIQIFVIVAGLHH